MTKTFKEMISDIAAKECIPNAALALALKEQSAVDAVSNLAPYCQPQMRGIYRMLAEVCDDAEREESGDDSKMHPRITLNMDNLTMTVQDSYPYEIDLETFTTSARVLDMIFQVVAKPWCDLRMAGELIHAIEDACEKHFCNNAQGIFCPCGDDNLVDWEKKKYRRRK